MFGMLIVCYLFLGGCGAGLLFVSSIASVAFYASGRRTAFSTLVFANAKNRCTLMGLALLIISALCLVGDLGRPERIIYLVLQPRWSVITFGAYALASLIFVCGAQAVLAVFDFSWVKGTLKRGLEIACAVLSLPVMVYTGVFLQSLDAVVLWATPLLPVLFTLSALSTGLAAFFVALSLADRIDGIECIVARLHLVHGAVLVVELMILAGFLTVASSNPDAAVSAGLLRDDLFWWLCVGVVGAGLVVPLAGEVLQIVRPRWGGLPLGDILCLVGGFALRYCIVNAGAH